ncbi:MAG: hypothetical protein H7249_09005 [Chitinophagaceae bacterium]|nr:hypothetical protein [Oligoflexus sp.]
MKNLFSHVLTLGLLAQLSTSCGETVNYDTKVKVADASLGTGAASGSGGGDAVAGQGNASGGDAASGAPSSGATSGSASGNGTIGTGVDATGLSLLCQSVSAIKSKQVALVFPEIPAGTNCSWGTGENLSRRDGFFRAYLKQTQLVTLPVGAKICSLAIAHQPAAMRYDDEMFFSVNEKLLLATKDYSEYFPKKDFFQTFSWANLVNKPYISNEARPVFCAGGAEGLSQCSVPNTETQGQIQMTFGSEMNLKLSEVLQDTNLLTFEWITTGDNDDSDCRHTEIDLNLNVSYVVP